VKIRQNTYQAVITGIVVPSEWDAKGNVTAIVISTPDEEEYLVRKDKKGAELLALIQQLVEVSGLLGMEETRKAITVETYSKITEYKPRLDE
jgi:hypothetical protein